MFVTHDIDEALFLSDVVHLMSPRPGRIILSLEVDIPRPRKYGEVVTSAHFNGLKASLLQSLGKAGMKSGIWPPLLLGAGIIAAWEIYVRAAGIDPLLLPPPSAVARYLVENARIMVRNGAATLIGTSGGIFQRRNYWVVPGNSDAGLALVP